MYNYNRRRFGSTTKTIPAATVTTIATTNTTAKTNSQNDRGEIVEREDDFAKTIGQKATRVREFEATSGRDAHSRTRLAQRAATREQRIATLQTAPESSFTAVHAPPPPTTTTPTFAFVVTGHSFWPATQTTLVLDRVVVKIQCKKWWKWRWWRRRRQCSRISVSRHVRLESVSTLLL